MDVPVDVGAAQQRGLVALALEVVKEDVANALAIVCLPPGRHGMPTAQLPAHHLDILEVPGVITHCSPLGQEEHLHAAFAAVAAVHQAQES